VTTTHDLQTRITGAIRTQQLFRPGDTLIIGLSGGADSCALLDLLANLPAFPLRLIVAHLNHTLRGSASDEDEEFCRDLAAHYQIPFEARRVDVKALAAKESLNLEDAGRRARIAFFDELRDRWQAVAVVLAHHADDQAETLLMRLLRGSGMSGLVGMPWRNGRNYVRPLLEISRSEIEAYLSERQLNWREDASNRDTSFLRNRIRHELLPRLEQYNPAVRQTLTTTASILYEEDRLLHALTLETAGRICHFTDNSAECPIPLLNAQPLALQRRIIRLMLSRLAGNLEQITHRHLEYILRMGTATRPNLRIDLPRALVALKEYDRLVITTADQPGSETREIVVPGPGKYRLPDGAEMVIEFATRPFKTGTEARSAYFDLERAPFPWLIRTFRPGDRIQPLGMSGRKKVKDLFIDEKIPRARRASTQLVFSGDELIWVAGLRTSQLSRVDTDSTRVVKAVF